MPSYANTSAVANPQSNTSSSVSNFATQVLTGPMTENTYGNGIKCSGATLSISPFATTSVAIKRPQDYTYLTPVYNEATDSDGNLTNAGEILFYRENYSGNKDATSFNFGIAATISVPLDKRFQDACLKSATTQEKIQILDDLKADPEANESIIRRIDTFIKDDIAGITPKDKRLKNKPVIVRARFIAERLQDMPKEQIPAYLKELEDKEILNDRVARAITEIESLKGLMSK